MVKLMSIQTILQSLLKLTHWKTILKHLFVRCWPKCWKVYGKMGNNTMNCTISANKEYYFDFCFFFSVMVLEFQDLSQSILHFASLCCQLAWNRWWYLDDALFPSISDLQKFNQEYCLAHLISPLPNLMIRLKGFFNRR